MSKHTFYGIQQISTGKLLPAPRGRGGRGGTRVNFDDAGTPRLFTQRQHADTALKWWLGGEIHVSYHEDYNGEVDEDWSVVKREDRSAQDCRVVELAMTVML